MNKIWVIARREFMVTVTRKGYIFAVVGMPLLFGGIFGVSFLTNGTLEQSIKSGSGSIAVVDRSKTLDFELATDAESVQELPTPATEVLQKAASTKPSRLVSYTDMTQAIQDLKNGKLSAVYLIESDYMSSGKIIAYSPERGMFSDLAPPDRSRLYDLIRASLIKGRIDGETRERILAPGKLKQMKVSKNGEVENAHDAFQKAARFFGPFSMFLLLTMSIFFSSGYLLQGIAEEKQNRVIEVIWASVDPMELLTGKIIGLGAAGLSAGGVLRWHAFAAGRYGVRLVPGERGQSHLVLDLFRAGIPPVRRTDGWHWHSWQLTAGERTVISLLDSGEYDPHVSTRANQRGSQLLAGAGTLLVSPDCACNDAAADYFWPNSLARRRDFDCRSGGIDLSGCPGGCKDFSCRRANVWQATRDSRDTEMVERGMTVVTSGE